MIHLLAPEGGSNPGFRAAGIEFVEEHHERLIADALSVLAGEKQFITERYSRFSLWDSQVLLAAYLKAKHFGQRDLTPSELSKSWEESTGRRTSTAWVSRRLRMAIRGGKLGGWLAPKTLMHGCSWVFDPEKLGDE